MERHKIRQLRQPLKLVEIVTVVAKKFGELVLIFMNLTTAIFSRDKIIARLCPKKTRKARDGTERNYFVLYKGRQRLVNVENFKIYQKIFYEQIFLDASHFFIGGVYCDTRSRIKIF